MKKLALHWKILIGMILGVVLGLIAAQFPSGISLVKDWIKPLGTIFIKLLKLIAVPLVIVSLAKGITDFKDMASLSKIGGRTIVIYLFTTVFAVILGLFLVNIFSPGSNVSPETMAKLSADSTSMMTDKIEMKQSMGDKGPLDFIESLVPQNFFGAANNNSNMLQIIFVTIFFSICMLILPALKVAPV